MSARYIVEIIEPLIVTPVLRSIVSMYLRVVPYENSEAWKDELAAGKEKELIASMTLRHPSLQYPFFHSYADCQATQVHPSIPLRPLTSFFVRKSLLQWKSKLATRMLIPLPSSKSMGKHSSAAFEERIYPHLREEDRPGFTYSTCHLETFYADTGRYVDGPCEVRYAWKYNDLKPRVYYAMGAEAYFASRYVWAIFDSLQQTFNCTDPHQRYSFHRFPNIQDSDARFTIYDYAAFSSNLVELKGFVAELACFLDDVIVPVFDTHCGVVHVSVGSILTEYNAICNMDPRFSIHRLEQLAFDDPVGHRHQLQAGLLGVYGNIAACTVLHGIIAILISGSEDRNNVVGDDGGMLTRDSDISFEEVKDGIQVLGVIPEKKFATWDEDEESTMEYQGWHFLKRPITRSFGVITQGWMPDFPILATILGLIDEHHTEPEQDFTTRRRLCIKQTSRFFDALMRHSLEVTEDDIECSLSLLERVYTRLRLNPYGSLPMRVVVKDSDSSYPDELLCVPPLSSRVVKDGWFAVLRERAYDAGTIVLPIMSHYAEDLPETLVPGHSFFHRGDKVLALLEKIGVVAKEVEREEILCDERALDLLGQLILRRVKPLYHYTVLCHYPQWSSYYHYAFPDAPFVVPEVDLEFL